MGGPPRATTQSAESELLTAPGELAQAGREERTVQRGAEPLIPNSVRNWLLGAPSLDRAPSLLPSVVLNMSLTEFFGEN